MEEKSWLALIPAETRSKLARDFSKTSSSRYRKLPSDPLTWGSFLMPAISGQFDWRNGLIWQVGFVAGDVEPTNNLSFYPALVDTGASMTCISRAVADDLGLSPIGKIPMQTAGGKKAANIYNVQLAFIIASRVESDGSQSGEVQVTPISVVEFDPGDNPFQALIGREFLSRGVLNLSFDGHYSFSF
ncbi:MAG: hypothetical protein F4Y89_06915 [Gammaproteobacteria bacterium]|nr:hypothetical protein [Gammaproteobacteria bacterium]MYG97383.1 hypothetical protein [Gammaproteobacteria bacterium]